MVNQHSNEAAAAALAELSEDELYEQLGRRVKSIATYPELAGDPMADFPYEAERMGPLDDLREFGSRLFDRLLSDARVFICGDDAATAKEREELLKSFGADAVKISAALSVFLVGTVGLAPAAAAAVAAIILKKIVPATLDELCQWWNEKATAA